MPEGNAGGVERFCWLLARALEGEGWRVSIVGPGSEPGLWTYRFGGSPLHWSLSTGRAVRAAGDADLIMGNGFLGLGAPRGAPRVQVFHGTSVAEAFGARPGIPRRDFLRRVVSYGAVEALTARSGHLVAVSESTAEETRRYYRRAPEAVIPNGVDLDVFSPRDRAEARQRLGLRGSRSWALFVGRLEYRKGATLLSESCRRAGWELVIAGAQGLPGAHHLGVLSPPQLADAYAAADCLLFPTRYEACSYVILEAIACGTPVVTTRVGWTRTLLRAVPSYDSLCVRPDAGDITTRLGWLRDVDTSAATEQARAFVAEHNSLARFKADWLTLLDEVVRAG